jgi:hypothetical protein
MKPVHVLGFLTAAGVVTAALVFGVRRRRQLGYREAIPGGRAAGMSPRDFDSTQLMVGTLIEMEHTTDPYVAREVAMDHIAEDGIYYTRLCRMHHEPPCKLLTT